ncbi:MAG: DUF3108 domain-containing protein [Candidatus Acidiferrales bacterium]
MTAYENRSRRGRFAAMFVGVAALLALPAMAQAPAGPQKTAHHKVSRSKADPPGLMRPVAMPFRAGETLNYRVSWSAFSNAASVQLTVPEQRDLFGYSTWHFRAQAHTLNPMRSLFSVDDQFDSYADQGTLEARQYETHLDELGRIQDQVFHFTAPGQTSRTPGPNVVVVRGTRDPLGTLYELRHVDWEQTPELRGTVYDGHDLYEMTAKRETTNDSVAIAVGTFSTSRIAIDLSEHEKPVPGVHVIVWIANDAARTPVLMQAQLPFGNVRAELTAASH